MLTEKNKAFKNRHLLKCLSVFALIAIIFTVLSTVSLSAIPSVGGDSGDAGTIMLPVTGNASANRGVSLTGKIMIPLNIVCLLFTAAVLYGVMFENKTNDKKTRAFVIVVEMLMLALLSDLFSYAFEGNEHLSVPLYIATTFAMIMGEVTAAAYINYAVAVIRERRPISKLYAAIPGILNFAIILFVVIETFFGNTFEYIGGEFVTYDLYDFAIYAGLVNLIYIVILMTGNAKTLGLHDTVAILVYCIFPFITVIYEFINPTMELAFVATSLSVFVIYIMLQSKKYNEMNIRHQLLEEMSYIDVLTGLKNRRSYAEMVETKAAGSHMGIIFADLNGLKYINDTMGHKGGDKYLKDFASLLMKHFRKDDIYRISGDEFVVAAVIDDEDDFQKTVDSFSEDIRKSEIASFGCVVGDSIVLKELIDTAEKEMYRAKDNYYLSNPSVKRRQK